MYIVYAGGLMQAKKQRILENMFKMTKFSRLILNTFGHICLQAAIYLACTFSKLLCFCACNKIQNIQLVGLLYLLDIA